MNSRAPAGWYPDPEHPEWVRYWDGDVWFKSSPTPPGQSRPLPTWAALVLALLILGLIGFFSLLALAAGFAGLNAGL